VLAIFEKRICTFKPPYTVDNYDPNRFFHGSANRKGDFPSWNILFDLAKKMNVSLILFTFDTSENKKLGAAKITGISQLGGITYKNNVRPCNRLFSNDLPKVKEWLLANS